MITINHGFKKAIFIYSVFQLLNMLSSTSYAQSLTINNRAHLVMNGSVSLVVNNAPINNNGKFTANKSTVKFTGNRDTASSLVTGDSATNFYNLTVAKSNYSLAKRNNTCTSNTAVSSSGNMYINNYLIMANSVLINNKNNSLCNPKAIKSN